MGFCYQNLFPVQKHYFHNDFPLQEVLLQPVQLEQPPPRDSPKMQKVVGYTELKRRRLNHHQCCCKAAGRTVKGWGTLAVPEKEAAAEVEEEQEENTAEAEVQSWVRSTEAEVQSWARSTETENKKKKKKIAIEVFRES